MISGKDVGLRQSISQDSESRDTHSISQWSESDPPSLVGSKSRRSCQICNYKGQTKSTALKNVPIISCQGVALDALTFRFLTG